MTRQMFQSAVRIGSALLVPPQQQQATTVPEPNPDITPCERLTCEPQACDHSGGDPNGPDIAGIAPGVDFGDLDAATVIRDCRSAIETWPDAPRFYAHLARGYVKDGQLDKAYGTIRIGMEKGSGQSIALMGALYQFGYHVEKDLGQALHFYEKAAAADNPGGMIFAASMYYHGEGTEPDVSAAARYRHMAADIGIVEAYANPGILYDSGQGVPRDADEAAYYLLLALALDNDLARTTLLEEFRTLMFETRIAFRWC